MSDLDLRLRDAEHGVLTLWARPGGAARLVAVGAPAWWDGAGVWLAAGAVPDEVVGRPPCTLLLSGPADGPRDGGVAVRGPVRVFGLRDPVGLALHGPAITGALAALALRGPATVRRAWPGLPPREVAMRVAVDGADVLRFPAASPGLAPGLPGEVPADVRRDLAGVREVVVLPAGGPGAHPACWGGGMELDEAVVPPGPCGVVVRAGHTGLALEGALRADRRFTPVRALWWRQGARGEAAVRAGVSAIVLPD